MPHNNHFQISIRKHHPQMHQIFDNMQRHQMMKFRMLVQNLLTHLNNPFHRKFDIWIIIVFYSQLYNNISNSKSL